MFWYIWSENRTLDTQSLQIWLHSMDCVWLLFLITSSSFLCVFLWMLDWYVFFFGCWIEILMCFVLSFIDSSFVPPLIYAVMGSSRDIAIGPVAVVSLLLGTLLQNEVDPNTHPTEYRRLAFTATFFAGITQATLGVFRYDSLILGEFTFEFF